MFLGLFLFYFKVNGKVVMEKLDVVQMASGVHRELVREIDVVAKNGNLVIELRPRTKRLPVLFGVEVIAK